MVNWPDSLVTELAERRCVVFLGAGASAGCVGADGVTRPKDWEGLLKDAADTARLGPDDRAGFDTLLNEKSYLDAAQVVMDKLDAAQRTQFFRRTYLTPRFQPSALHRAVAEIDPKIVVTTNYDTLYENYCQQGDAVNGYNVCLYYNTHAINDIRSDIRCIIKAHGSVTDPSNLVLTRASYFEARREHPEFYSVLDALFLVNTILFIGAGLNDPDIQLVLENASISAPSAHPHYALVSGGRHASLVSVIKRTYNIQLLEYEPGRHEQAATAVEELRDRVLERRMERNIR
jgi:hypothetical protein